MYYKFEFHLNIVYFSVHIDILMIVQDKHKLIVYIMFFYISCIVH